MTKKEAIRQTHQEHTLMSLGFTRDEAESLRRISIRLRSWFERECGTDGGCIERDEATDRPYWINSITGRRFPIRDMETGARKRLAFIINARNARESYRDIATKPAGQTIAEYIGARNLSAYIQTDPRGCALYVLRPGDVPEGADPSAYYSRGIAVY
jgi:hypothetical protein